MKYQSFKLLMSSIILAGLIAVNSHACDLNEEKEGSINRYLTHKSMSALPPEVFKKILAFLDKKSLKACRQVSRYFAIVQNMPNVQDHSNNPLIVKLKTNSDFNSYLAHN